ncbi:C4-dicarboxylate ABC transporter substrate-binding protein [Paraburkholderia ginsengiterrae]|uniref:C4-dicarboxylate ABC transporter substrate-binding protein n=1 Tax=Paraburkholderia ginsengiterrae TaxID=1462993 RepID=A0A1A9NBT2_9BURK|nr:TAXI family TRAP transporter solute-binding subunit [Paraburkholderia ginsengiterrae]OAJ60057.1 C4-dicarboxylate ABC transporter substrate-binding protein [Paraburkholderia ginsengiterrae]OAJ63191.1 C4-dicarboxylate ABC transporter substrate-binding protein [Paraburkholderia ginsengiterrae]
MKAPRPRPPHFPGDPHHAEWRDHTVAYVVVAAIVVIVVGLIVWLIDPAPPRTITMSAGPHDSSFLVTAEQYRKILARNGITLNVLESDGSVQNLKRLLDPEQRVDIALVQGGIAGGLDTSSLMSLGSVFYIPVVVFYRGAGLNQLSQLEGKRIAVGREGSGTRMLALALLKANGIVPGGSSVLVPSDGMQAATQLIAGDVDAAILNGDSATRDLMLRLLRVPGISVMDFSEASAYTRIFPYLNEIDLPPGVLDLQHTIPPETIHLISPTVELVARTSLHPAISDLLIEAAQEVHGTPGLLQHAGEFPSPVAHEYQIGADAQRYYKTGKSFLYRTLPFWLASIADRTLFLLLPVAVLLVPAMRLIPALYGWRVRSRIYRYYGSLIAIERAAMADTTAEERKRLFAELDQIEGTLNRLRMPLAYADAFYVLREHVGFVRSRLAAGALQGSHP